ncbi:DUF3116 family protein [Listeria costaricensis]|uniref:DUF3116 family protein n=1 Tax=Listeria costaricensis TaxID=2026604 RepID=UPI000C067F15|nr:DUF3116 family protein [Listeria costaricensis]
MWHPTEKDLLETLKLVKIKGFVLVNLQEETIFEHYFIGLDKSCFLRTLYWLEANQFVFRTPIKELGKKRYYLTDEGEALLKKLQKNKESSET